MLTQMLPYPLINIYNVFGSPRTAVGALVTERARQLGMARVAGPNLAGPNLNMQSATLANTSSKVQLGNSTILVLILAPLCARDTATSQIPTTQIRPSSGSEQ
mmetsp:Transcript_46646/g.76496  ORF Transcript_46646/g.76496 Transcript_46646/m.76496 type:complete len:103 (+) Transcript_46646:674-982(+)